MKALDGWSPLFTQGRVLNLYYEFQRKLRGGWHRDGRSVELFRLA